MRCAVVALCVAVFAACSGAEGAETPPSTVPLAVGTTAPPAPTTTAPSVSERYFATLAGGAASAAVAGSDAERYAQHRARASQVLAVGGGSAVTSLPDSVEVCTTSCTVFDDIVTDPATGAVDTFSVDGEPIAGRIRGAGPAVTIDDVSMQISSAYRNDEALAVVVTIDNASQADVTPFGFAATWLAADALDALEATGSWGDDTVAPGSTGSLLITFDPVAPVGQLAISGVRSDTVDVEFTLDVG